MPAAQNVCFHSCGNRRGNYFFQSLEIEFAVFSNDWKISERGFGAQKQQYRAVRRDRLRQIAGRSFQIFLLPQIADAARTGDAEALNEVVDPASRDSENVCLLDDREQGAFGPPARIAPPEPRRPG